MEALDFGYRERVTDVHLPQIRDLPTQLPGLFSGAARRAREAGFDGVELHYAHAYTMASFLSRVNSRDDGFGGGPENRVRLPLEVYSRVRAEVGADFALGCRFLADECIEGGNDVNDAVYFGREFARAAWTLSRSRGAANSTMPNSPRWAEPHIPTRAGAAMNACPPTTPTPKALLAATSSPQPASAQRFASSA